MFRLFADPASNTSSKGLLMVSLMVGDDLADCHNLTFPMSDGSASKTCLT
jgi:hypothetical protein